MQNHHLSDKAGEKQDGAFLAFEFRGRRNAFWNFNDHLLQMLLLPSPPRPKSNISPFSRLLLCGRILSWVDDDDQGGDKDDLDDGDDDDHCDDLGDDFGDDQLKYSPVLWASVWPEPAPLSLSPCQRLNAEITSCP